MLNPKSNYALNKKDRDAIVYYDANHRLIRLTRDDFDTEADFRKWKEWSDKNYHEEELADHIHADHNISSDALLDTAAKAPSPEIIIEQRITRLEQQRYTKETIVRIKGKLSDKQFDRVWKRYAEGMKVEDIARAEGKSHSSVSESISRATKKILAFLSKNPT